jgi:Carbohydrate esterase, sialic acid-specific acetylesterase
MKNILIALLTVFSFSVFAQTNVIGSASACRVDNNPNNANILNTLRNDVNRCEMAYDTVAGIWYKFDKISNAYIIDDIIKKDTIYFAIDGQSNALGQGVPLFPKTYSFESNLKVWNTATNAWIAPVLGQNPFNSAGPNLGANNAGVQFANKYAKLNKNTLVRLFVGGNSGQPISYWLTGTGVSFVDNMVTAANINKKIAAFIWIQGESDNSRTSSQYYADYYTLRSTWLTKSWFDKSTKHINVGLYIGTGGTSGAQDVTLRKIGNDSILQTSYANSYGLVTYDNLHWNDTSLTKFLSIYTVCLQRIDSNWGKCKHKYNYAYFKWCVFY